MIDMMVYELCILIELKRNSQKRQILLLYHQVHSDSTECNFFSLSYIWTNESFFFFFFDTTKGRYRVIILQKKLAHPNCYVLAF